MRKWTARDAMAADDLSWVSEDGPVDVGGSGGLRFCDGVLLRLAAQAAALQQAKTLGIMRAWAWGVPEMLLSCSRP